MKVYGHLERAQFEVLSGSPSGSLQGRFWYNSTDGKNYFDNGSQKRAFLANDDKLVIGNHATANNNIRLHRAGTGVLQLVVGGDATAEGSLSTSLAQLGFRAETFTSGTKPAAGNAGRIIYLSDSGAAELDTGANWLGIFGVQNGIGMASAGHVTKTANYTIVAGDDGKVIFVDSSAGAFALTLPAATSNFKVTIKDKAGALSTNAVTLARAAAESIEGYAGNYPMEADYGSWTWYCDGTNWWKL